MKNRKSKRSHNKNHSAPPPDRGVSAPAGKKRIRKKPDDGSHDETLFVVEGAAAIAEHLRHRPKSVQRLIGEPDAVANLTRESDWSGSVQKKSDWLDDNLGRDVKSSLFAQVRVVPMGQAELKDRLEKTAPKIVLALDHVMDPRNLGAIARTCGYFGIREIIVPKDRQVSLTPAAVATSQGAFSLVDLFQVTNLTRTLKDLKADGYWIVGADMNGEPVDEVAGFYDKVVLVMGNEGDGISRLVAQTCDRVVSVAGGPEPALESLNVSVAAGIIIRQFLAKA